MDMPRAGGDAGTVCVHARPDFKAPCLQPGPKFDSLCWLNTCLRLSEPHIYKPVNGHGVGD